MSTRTLITCVLFCVLALRCKGPEGPAGLPGDGVESLTDPAILPRVLTTYPVGGTTGPYTDFNNRITLRFNKIMDRTSIKRAVHLSSPRGDVQLDTTSIAAQNTDVFTLTPIRATPSPYAFYWGIGVAYSVTVDTSALDVNGNHLPLPFGMTFVPEPYFRVTGTAPAYGATEVPLTSSITIVFNSQVDSSIFRHVTISPPLKGVWGYIASFPAPDSTRIRFFSQGALFDTLYTLQIDTTAVDKYGHHFLKPFSSMFTTLTFRVTSTTPTNGSVSVGVLSTPMFTFTAPVDTQSMRRAMTISPAATGTFALQGSGNVCTFVPNPRLAANTTYTITLSDSLMSMSGSHLAQPFSMSFTTSPFRVGSTSPADGSVNVSLSARMSVTLTDYYDTSTIRSSVIISPSVPVIYTLTENSTSFTLRPQNGFQSNTTYIVMLMTGLHSERGDSLAVAASFSFTTTSFAVSSTYPQDGAQNVAPNTELNVYCNEAIDTGSIRTAFSISPSVGGDLLLSPGSSFSFRPYNMLDPNSVYTVTIGSSLASQGGETLPQAYSFSFSTGGFLVVPTNPYPGTMDFPLNSSITFSSNAYLDTASIRTAFSVSPVTAGNLRFNFSGAGCIGFGFQPVAWASNTRYTAAVSTALQTTSGVHLASPVSVVFTTTQFRIIAASPPNGSINVGPSPNIYLQCNGPIDTSGVDTVLSISPPVRTSLPSVVQGQNYISYSLYQSLRTNTRYTATVASSLKTVGGGTLAAPFTFVFTTVPFQVVSSTPQDGSVGISKTGTISISLNTYIDTSSVRGAFSISPAAVGDFYLYSPGYGFSFTPSAALTPHTLYTVQLSTAMRTQLGDTLLAPYVMSFTTGN